MKIGILCPLATFELHGVTDEIQAVAVMIKVRLHMFGKAGLRTAQRLVHHHEGLVRSTVLFIGEGVAESKVSHRKHLFREPNLMSVGHINLSLD